jgi:4-hydroxybenzoate polyprenyltransferase
MLNRLRTYLSFIRFSHSVFALPFALAGALLAAQRQPLTLRTVLWILVAMVSARSAAMGFNRLVDARFDALNPRTAAREIPRGAMRASEAAWFVAAASAVFVFASWQLSTLCALLSPLALAIVFWYSLAKRYTTYTQLFLGLAMAVAPVGGWLAAGGRASAPAPWLLGLAIGLWVGGFDILYACQDVHFDRRHGLKSIPARFGIVHAIRLSRLMHVATVAVMAGVWVATGLPPVYLVGVLLVAGLLAYEQSLVRADDLSQVKKAFDLNGYVGIVYLLTTAWAVYVE